MKNCGAMAKIVPVPDLVSCQDTDVKCKRPLHRNPRATCIHDAKLPGLSSWWRLRNKDRGIYPWSHNSGNINGRIEIERVNSEPINRLVKDELPLHFQSRVLVVRVSIVNRKEY